MSSSLLCFSATFSDRDDDDHHYHDIYVVDVSSRRRRHTDIPSLTPTLRVSGQHFGDMSCVTSSGVFLFNSNFNLFLSGMEGVDVSKESADPQCVRRIDISKYHSSSTTFRTRPMKADHTMVEHVCPLISKKKYLRVFPTPGGKIIAFSTEISRPEPSTTTSSSSSSVPPDGEVDFELYHPHMDRWEPLPSIPRGLEIEPGSSALSGSCCYSCSSRIVSFWFMGGTSIFAVMCDGGFIFHLDLTASHRSWTYRPWPVSVRTNLAFRDGEYIYITDDWCLTSHGAWHLTGPMPTVPRWWLSTRQMSSSNREGDKMRCGVRDVGSERLPSSFYIVESTLIDNTMTRCKLSVCEYTCNIRPYLKQLSKMEAKQEAVTTKINKHYEVEERKVREAHMGEMKRMNELFKLMDSHSKESSYARVKQVPQLDCNVSSSMEFLLDTPPSFKSWILGDACFI